MPSSGGSGHQWVGSFFTAGPCPGVGHQHLFLLRLCSACKCFCKSQLSATDASARTTMKGAAKCDKRCELQNSVNQQGFERILCFRDIPESIPVSVSITLIPRRVALHGCAHAGVFVCQDVLTLTHVVYLSRTRYRPIIKALYAHFSCVSRARAYLYAHICLTM